MNISNLIEIIGLELTLAAVSGGIIMWSWSSFRDLKKHSDKIEGKVDEQAERIAVIEKERAIDMVNVHNHNERLREISEKITAIDNYIRNQTAK